MHHRTKPHVGTVFTPNCPRDCNLLHKKGTWGNINMIGTIASYVDQIHGLRIDLEIVVKKKLRHSQKEDSFGQQLENWLTES